MSGGPPAPGWWQANDGEWYPPESHPDRQPEPVAAAPAMGPLASTLAAGGYEPQATPPSSPTGASTALASTSTTEARPEPEKVTYDAQGWITIDEPRTAPAAPPPPPGWRSKLVVVLGIAVAALVVGAAAVTFIPRGTGRPADASTDALEDRREIDASDGTDDVDPLTLDAVMTRMNVQFSDVGHGYKKVMDGSIDPVGGEPCVHPQRPFSQVSSSHWVAYNYEPNGLGGLPLGHLAAVITVFESEDEAAKRLAHESTQEYSQCLQRWASWVWYSESGYAPHEEELVPLDVTVEGSMAVSYHYRTYFIEEGQEIPLYTDIITFTKGRVRAWVEVSSALQPFDPARRDLMVERLADRISDELD